MDKNELQKLMSPTTQARRFSEGEIVVQEGDPPDEGLCFVLSGSVRILQKQGGHQIPLGYVQTGQFFGETAMLLQRPRGASAVVDSHEAVILFLDQERFLAHAKVDYKFVRDLFLEARQRVEHVIQALVRTHATFRIMVDPSLAPGIKENRASNLKIPGMLNHTRQILVSRGKALFEQGKRNDGAIYLLTKGSMSAQRVIEGESKEFFVLEEGDFFGYSRPEVSSVREYSAVGTAETVQVVGFEEELLLRLMRLDMGIFFVMFRSILTQLVIFDDALGITAGILQEEIDTEKSREAIKKAFAPPQQQVVEKVEDPSAEQAAALPLGTDA